MNRHQIIDRINLSYKHLERIERNIKNVSWRAKDEDLPLERKQELLNLAKQMEETRQQIVGEIAVLKADYAKQNKS